MVGGRVQQVQLSKYGTVLVEVLDTDNFDRQWRDCQIPTCGIHVGDQLWWQSHTGYLTRDGEFEDRKIGRCTPADSNIRPHLAGYVRR